MSKRGLGKGLDALLSTSSLAREKQQNALHSQEVSTIYPSKPGLCCVWGCLPHPEVEFHARLAN